MRRNELDFGSQPVRNLYPNAGSESAGSTLTVRTNLAMDPSATAITQWSNIGSLSATRTVDSTIFHEGSSAIRFTANATGQIGAKCMMSGVIATNETVAWSVWLYSSVAVTLRPYWERTSPVYTGASGGSTIDLPAATWTKIQFAYTFNSSQADPAGVYGFGFLATTNFVSGDFIVCDEILMEKSVVVNPWFSGATPAAGDFTYSWSGTANNSPSLMRAPSVTSAVALNTSIIQSSDWSANGSKSILVQPGQTATTDTAVSLKGYTLKNGTYTLLATCRVKAPQTGSLDPNRARRIMLYYTGVGPSSSAAAPNTPGVYPLRVTFTVTDAAQYQDMRLYNGASAGGGDIWWDNIMLVEGDYQGDYINPTVTPLSRWDGTPNASSSVGYPAQISDLAGKPSLNLVGVNSGGVTIPVNAYDPRTIYLVYEDYGTTLNYPNYGSYGINGSNGITFQAGPAGNINLFPRLDFPGGSSNFGFVVAPGRYNQRRHVLAMAFNNGLTSLTHCLDGAADTLVNGFNPGSGWTDGRSNPVSSHADGKGVAMVVYYAEHDRATRLAVSRCLGNKYGANVA